MTTARLSAVLVLLAAFSLTSCGLLVTPEHRIAEARADVAAGKWRAASIQLNKALQSNPKSVEGWLLLAQVALDMGDAAHAEVALTRALAIGAKGPQVAALRVRTWLARGQPQAVLDSVAHHSLGLDGPAQAIALGRAYIALGQNGKAAELLEPVVQQHPDLSEASLVEAQALAGEGQADAALRRLAAALRQDPRSAQIPLLQGRILASRGRYFEAERSLTLALERMQASEPISQRVTALVALTEVQLASGEVMSAERSQATLASLDPGSPITKFLHARVRLARNDVNGALDELGLLVLAAPRFVQARMLLGTLDLNRRQFEQAIVQAHAVLQQSSGDIAARKLLAAAELELGRPADALRDLAPALTSRAPDAQAVILAGVAASRVGGAQSVLDRLEREGWADSRDPTVRLNLARAYLRANRPEDSLTILEKTPENGGLDRDSVLIAALRAARGPRAAADQMDQLVAAHPHEVGVLFLGGSYFASQRDFGRAQTLLRKALATDPKALPVRLALADALVKTRDFADAHEVLAAGTPSDGDPRIELALAQVDLAQGNLTRANAELDRAVASGPDRVAGVKAAVTLLIAAKQNRAALDRVDALLASAPHDPRALALKGGVEAASGDAAAAAVTFEKLQRQEPSAAGAVRLYQARLASGEAQPEAPLRQWLAQDPRDSQVEEILGEYYLSAHSLEPAARAFAAVLAQAPQNVTALNNLALVYGRLGDPRAAALAEQAYRLAPQVPEVADTLGWIQARGGKSAQSLPLLAYALKHDPSNPDFQYHYAYALVKTGKPAQARGILTKLLASPAKFDSRADAERLLSATAGAATGGARR